MVKFFDQVRVTLLTARATNNLQCMPIPFGLAQKNPLFASGPYTHLRAHVTLLALVCRLLLEKKKSHLPRDHTIPRLPSSA